MLDGFDPYRKWLGIRALERPLNHYQLLGLELFENDAETISHAVDQRIAYIRTLALGDYADLTQRVLNELATAKVCLLNPDNKTAYDSLLRARQAAVATPAGGSPQRPSNAPPPPPNLAPISLAGVPPSPRVAAPAPTVEAELPILPIGLDMRPESHVSAARVRPPPPPSRRSRRQTWLHKWLPLAGMAGLLAVTVVVAVGITVARRNQGVAGITDVGPGLIIPNVPPEPKPSPLPREDRSLARSEAPPHAIAPFSAESAKQNQEVWASYLKQPVVKSNSIGMKLALIPPGEFEMGSPPSEIGRVGHELQHHVRITKPFYMGVYEVTQKEYQTVMGKNPSNFSQSGVGKDQVHNLDTNQFPVESVSWDDAAEFCKRLSAMPAEQAAGQVYRLPTEAEWEYACRAGSSSAFCYGDDEVRLPQYASFMTNAKGRTWPVGARLANAWGLFDMHGNVWEWCWDWHGAYGTDPANDPTGPIGGLQRVFRGGAYTYGAHSCRCMYRYAAHPLLHYADDGFRVAMATTASSPAQPDDSGGKASKY